MAHFGVLSYQGAGHLNPLVVLSRELASRGHRVTFFLSREFEARIREQGLDFFPIDVLEDEPTSRGQGAALQPQPNWIEDTRAEPRFTEHRKAWEQLAKTLKTLGYKDPQQ